MRDYRVVYLIAARRAWHPGNLTLHAATKLVRSYKRRGMTAWVVTSGGYFFPVPGAKKEPGYLE